MGDHWLAFNILPGKSDCSNPNRSHGFEEKAREPIKLTYGRLTICKHLNQKSKTSVFLFEKGHQRKSLMKHNLMLGELNTSISVK